MKTLISFVLLLSCSCRGQLPGIESNVPLSRLTSNTYTALDNSFVVPIPDRLAKDGIKILEKKINNDDFYVDFFDYYGDRYSIIRSNRFSHQWTFESAATLVPFGEALKDSQYIMTPRGEELRLRFIRKGEGSTSITKLGKGPNGKDLVVKTDRVEANAMFFKGSYLFILTTSTDVEDSSHYKRALDQVNSNLNKFLYDLTFK